MRLKPSGLILVTAALGTPLVWWPGLAQGRDVVALGSQYLGIWALIAMAISQVIATRVRLVEILFGGLDRSYILHKWLGIGAMAAILLHDTIDAEMRGLGRETALVETAESFGEVSLYGLLILVVITVATFIPYHLWRWTHRLMGLFFAMGAFHYLFILKPFANGDPLGLYVSAFCLAGVLAFAYRLLPSGVRPARDYRVEEVTPTGRALAVTMAPEGKPLSYRAGQFAFATFEGAGMTSEPHPFTISSAPDDGTGRIRMSIAVLGDFTYRLKGVLKPGMPVRIEGPFGRFARPAKADPEIWIAAGIGITPFLAWAQALPESGAPVTLIYCVRDESEAAHLDELRALAKARPGLRLVLHSSRDKGRLTPEAVAAAAGTDRLDKAAVAFCGPAAMRKSLSEGLRRMGLPQSRFHYEEFEIRSGIGLRRLADWVLNRALRR